MIKASMLSKAFGSSGSLTRAIKDVSLTIGMNEMVSIMGPSGCGKSTLLHLLAGLEPPDQGEVWIDGQPIHRMKENQRSELRLTQMGFVFQQFHLIPVLTALENIALPLITRGVSDRQANKRAKRALEQVDLADKANRLPAELSGGQNQRIAIARAIVGEPRMIWADEPTGALDTKTAELTIGLLKKINEISGTAIIIVTHDEKVAASTNRIIQMENGRVVAERGGTLA